MTIVVDTSALLAVLLGEAERPALLAATIGAELVAPESVHWEVGNALSALLRRGRIELREALEVLDGYARIPLRLVEADLASSLRIASEERLYAYDAYLLSCAQMQRCPLLTLDRGLQRAAGRLGIPLVEVDL